MSHSMRRAQPVEAHTARLIPPPIRKTYRPVLRPARSTAQTYRPVLRTAARADARTPRASYPEKRHRVCASPNSGDTRNIGIAKHAHGHAHPQDEQHAASGLKKKSRKKKKKLKRKTRREKATVAGLRHAGKAR
eukprot:2945680-Rhodomonas_salina.2